MKLFFKSSYITMFVFCYQISYGIDGVNRRFIKMLLTDNHRLDGNKKNSLQTKPYSGCSRWLLSVAAGRVIY